MTATADANTTADSTPEPSSAGARVGELVGYAAGYAAGFIAELLAREDAQRHLMKWARGVAVRAACLPAERVVQVALRVAASAALAFADKLLEVLTIEASEALLKSE